MRTAVLAFAIVLLAIEHVNAQRYGYYHRDYLRYRRPIAIYPAGSTIVRTYVPSTFTADRDVNLETTQVLGQEDAEKVRLDVYYETDCPDSMRFITNQLYPLYQEMEDVLDIHLVPYGKASESYNSISQRYSFRCQHGPSECYGNTIQSCAMSLYPNKKDHFDFIKCMQSYPRPSRNGNKCARRLSLDWEKIDKCARGDEGNRLLHENAQLTENLEPRLYFVPWIVVDKVFTESNQRMALRNLRGVVCNAYKGNHPKCPR